MKRKIGQEARMWEKGAGRGPHLSRDLVLVIMRKMLELSKNIFSSGEGFRTAAASLLPVFPT